MRFRLKPRRIIWPLFSVTLLLGIAWLVLLSSATLTRILTWGIESTVGTIVEVKGARWDGWGRLEVDSVVVLAPEWPGSTSQILQIEKFRVEIKPWHLLVGRVEVRELNIVRATVRVAETRDALGIESFNLNAIHPAEGGWMPSLSIQMDHVSIEQCLIENYSVRDGKPELRGDRAFRGLLTKKPNAPIGELDFELVEIEAPDLQTREMANDVPSGVRMDGKWNEIAFSYELDANRLDFTETVRPLLPLALQQSCDTLGLKGTVTNVKVAGSMQKPLSEAKLDLRDVAIHLPDLGDRHEWLRLSEGTIAPATGRPSMAVEHGTITLKDNQLFMTDFHGQLLSVDASKPATPPPNDPDAVQSLSVPLPASFSLVLDFRKSPPPADLSGVEAWFTQALMHCGVEIQAKVPEYALLRSVPDQPWVAELPETIVKILDNFQVKSGRISIDAKASRNASAISAPAEPLKIEGSLAIHEGRGAYVNFNYPIHDVEADIRFHGDSISVKSLTAKGTNDCGISISGHVVGADDDAGVDLRIHTTSDAPIEPLLENAFDPGPRRIFQLLFARTLRDRLVASGLLHELDTQLGGQCQFDIRVQRPRHGGSRVITTGSIEVTNARVLCERFPYPITVEQGHIDLEDERIVLPRGRWLFSTRSGGEGMIDGVVNIPRVGTERDARPDINIRVTGDRINDLLLAAIPLEDWERQDGGETLWPGGKWSVAATSLRALGAAGTVSMFGNIGSDADGDTILDLSFTLNDGRIEPRNGTERLLEQSGLSWPEGFDIHHVEAEARVTETMATLEKFQGLAGEGSVTARGHASLLMRDRELFAQLKHAPIGPWIVPLLPDAVQDSTRHAWRDCNVHGFFNGDIHMEQNAGVPDRRLARFDSDGLHFSVGNDACELRVVCGFFEFLGPTLTLHDIHVQGFQNNVSVGELTADGSIALDTDGVEALQGAWSVHHLASPLVGKVMEAANLHTIADLQRLWNPVGHAHGLHQVAHTATGELDWSITFDAGSHLIADPHGVPIRMDIPEASSAVLRNHRIELINAAEPGAPALQAFVPGGSCLLHGSMATGAGSSGEPGSLTMDFSLAPLEPSVARVLPIALAEGIQAIDLRASVVHSEGLHLLGCSAVQPHIGLQGNIRMEDGSLNAGTQLERIHALFGIHARGGRPVPVEIELGGGSGSFMVRDRYLSDVSGTLRVHEAADSVELVDLQGMLYGGRAWASAKIGGSNNTWSLRVGMAGADLPSLIQGGQASQTMANEGTVNGSLSLGGTMHSTEEPRGIGRIQATAARMGELPFTLRLLQATQLMIPLSDTLDSATVDFHVRGNHLRFDRFDLTCPTLKLLGSGSMDLSTWNVAMRFRNRGTLPLVSDLLGAASDNLFVIDVTGPAGDPEVHLTPLPPLGNDPSRQIPSDVPAEAHSY